MLRPPGVTDAPPARRVRGRRSSLVLGVLILTAVVSTRWVRLNLSPSMPRGVYGLVAVPVNVPRGALVVLPVPGSVQPWHRWWIPLLKPVAGVPGDVVCHQNNVLRVNNMDYGPVYLEAHGKFLPQLDAGCQTVPMGMVFLASQSPKSLDGRYLGMTPVVMLTARATPLLTWRYTHELRQARHVSYPGDTRMNHHVHAHGLRQRVSQFLTWFLGRTQTREPYTQGARPQADGFFRGQDDPDTRQRYAAQHHEQWQRQQQQGWGNRHGR